MLVSNYMTAAPVTIGLDADYGSAFDIMEDKNMHHLPVVDAAGEVVGILTRRDLQLAARHFQEAPVEVAEVMHTPVSTIKPDTKLSEAAAMMMEQHIGGLPVMDDNNHIIGIVTETDLFRALMDSLKD
jgi:acetoin utilization protein AcuB